MDFSDSVAELQRIADYRMACKTLKKLGRATLFWGVLNLAASLPALGDHVLNFILVLIALLMVVEGIWNTTRPSAAGILIDGLVFSLVGLWNIFISVEEMLLGAPSPRVQWLIIGFIQIGWGIYRFVSYRRYHQALSVDPLPEDVKKMDALINQIQW